MKIIVYFIFFLILLISVPSSFAEEQIVSLPKYSNKPGCQDLDLCYIPSPLIVKVGQTVSWKNNDYAVHTVTSGTPDTGPDGIIYSGLMSPDDTFAFKFKDPGSFQYYCQLHPWMEGLVIAELGKEQITQEDFEIIETRMSIDGTVLVTIKTNQPDSGNELPVRIEFTNQEQEFLISMNYDITAIQDNEIVLSSQNIRAVDGVSELKTIVLESDNPLDIEVALRGIYADESSKEIQEVIEFQNIPEFGTITLMILVISIIGITIFSKSRLNVNNF